MHKKIISLLLVAFLLVGVLAACGQKAPAENNDPVDTNNEQKTEDTNDTNDANDSETGSAEGEIGGTLVVGVTEMSGNFNPAYYSSAYDGNVVDLVFQSLIKRDKEENWVPDAAKSWEILDDGKTIVFELRDDIVFSDGEPLTAEDVLFTYMVLADPSYTGRYSSVVQDLEGYEEYVNGETDEFKGIEIEGDYKVTFHFKEALRVNLKNCAFPIMPKHHYGAEFEPGNTEVVAAITTTPLGSGPYVLDKFEEQQFASLKRNPNYKGEGYRIENIVCKFVDLTTDITELTSKGVDLLPGVIDPEKINQARATGFIKENSYARSGYGYINFNTEHGPTADPKVRQALYYSFALEEFVNSYFKDEESGEVLANIQYHPYSQLSWAVDDEFLGKLNKYEYNLEKAASILDEAGWTVGSSGYREKDGQVLELNIAAMPDHDILNTLIPMWQRDWEETLKIKLNVAYLEFNTMLDYILYDSDNNVDKWSLFFLAASIPSKDPHELYSEFHSKEIGSGKDNTARYRNDRVDELFDKAKAIFDIEEAKPMYQEIALILNEEVPKIPVYANTYFDLYNEKLKNFETNSLYDWAAAMEEAYIEE